MKRNIITIDEAQCNGCGQCVTGCPEGALQVINGKARLVGELLCDGLGACIGACPQSAMRVETREAEPYDENKVMDNVVQGGAEVIAAHLQHLKNHGQTTYAEEALAYLRRNHIPVPAAANGRQAAVGCPGSMMKDFRQTGSPREHTVSMVNAGPSQLRQWPVQLQLLNPHAPYFKDADLLIAADCVPFAFAHFHERFLSGKVLVIFCPKLDQTIDAYIDKLTTILADNNITSITVVHMEVPCCGGTVRILEEALKRSGKNIVVKDYTISLRGEIV